jgi:hypothetical protein
MSAREELEESIYAALAEGDLARIEQLREAAADAGDMAEFEAAYAAAWQRHQAEHELPEDERAELARQLVEAENAAAADG